MRIHDRLVIGRLVFCALASAAVGLGCGSESSGVDSGKADGSPDGRGQDVSTPDSGNKDVHADLPPSPDGATDVAGDALPPQDRPLSDGAAEDGPMVDGALTDGGESDAAADDGRATDAGDASGADGGASTQANITFVLKNTGSTVLYLTRQCWVEFQVASLADGTVYKNQSFCLCDCSDTACQGEINCSPCAPRDGLAVAPGGTREVTWVAQTDEVRKQNGSMGEYSCLAHSPIATGTHRVSVPVFSSASDAAAQINATTASATFELGTSDARIEVPLN